MNKWSVDYAEDQFKKIYCGGLIPQVVFSPTEDGARVEAVSEDRSVFVTWEGPFEIPEEIGIMHVSLLKGSLSKMGDHVRVVVRDNRLILSSEDSRIVTRLVLGHPNQITTKIPNPDAISQINSMFSEKQKQELPASVLKEVSSAQKLIGSNSETITLKVSPEGSTFVVGSDTENIAEVKVPELTDSMEYTLELPADTFQKVVSVLYEDANTTIRLAGPNNPIEIREGSLRYIIG